MRKNKLLKIFIAIVLLISIETSAIAATTGIVNVETVRVRKEATTNSDIVELVSIGDKITITGEEGNWYKVKVGKITGYIRKDLLTVEGETTEVSTTVDNNDDNNNGGQVAENNNLDNENTNEAEEPENNNAETSVDGTTGEEKSNTDNSSMVVETSDKTISTIKIAGGVSAGKTVQLTQETKIKILPSANSTNIASLSENTEVTVLEVINSWCRIETTEGECGWVRIDQ